MATYITELSQYLLTVLAVLCETLVRQCAQGSPRPPNPAEKAVSCYFKGSEVGHVAVITNSILV